MDLPTLKEELLQGKLRPTYLFVGDELALQDIYIDKICEISGFDKVVVDSLQQVYGKLNARSLIKVSPKVYVTRNDEPYYKQDKIWEKVIQGKNQGKNIIIQKYTGIDKRGKFYKTHEEIAVDFEFIGNSILANRVQAITKWPIQYCQDLVRLCGCNYGRILHEIENLQILSKSKNCTMNDAYVEAIKSNFIHEEIGDIIFDFTNAVTDRQPVKCFDLLNKIKQTDEGPVKLLSVLYNSFRNLMLVQSTKFEERTEEILGLTKAQIFVTSKKCGVYNIFEIVDIVKLIQKIEEGIKTGQIDQQYAIDYLLSQIF